jgi:hypothetical protein
MLHVRSCLSFASLPPSSFPTRVGTRARPELLSLLLFIRAAFKFLFRFLDAFNYALHTKVDVLNLSIGGPGPIRCENVPLVT